MPCYKPLDGYMAIGGGFTSRKSESNGTKMSVPCGQCIGCRLERSRQWAVRCMHEASLYDENCFLTLTYSPECLPDNGSLDHGHFQEFMKRLRKAHVGRKIRFFMCGEYGDESRRAHYHAILFNFDFADKVLFRRRGEYSTYISSELSDRFWQKGHCEIGSVTFESAAYVARYCLKKRTGADASAHYGFYDSSTGEWLPIKPEYCQMSRRPGIGHDWFVRFGKEVFPSDEVIVNGHSAKPPRYYEKLLSDAEPVLLEKVKRRRLLEVNKEDNTCDRLRVREAVARARSNLKKRGV